MPDFPLEVILLEPFFKGSHAAWAEGYRTGSRHRVRLLVLEGTHWKWRFHHSALHFAEILSGKYEPPSVLLVSSMTDAAALKGLLPPSWASVPLLLYFHENQLTYPLPPGEKRDLHYAWLHVQSCMAAAMCVFNSRFHMEDFLGALPGFLRSFPDHRPLHLVEEIRKKSRVVPPGVETGLFREARARAPRREGPLRILWNHRWEADKEPGAFLEALARLAREGLPFEAVLAGPGAEDPGPELEERIRSLGRRVIHRGFAPPGAYPELLASCDVVASTSRHDFFGMSVVEGMAAGLLPILPDRQNYPALTPPGLEERCLYRNPEELLDRLRREAARPEETREAGREAAAFAARFDLEKTTRSLDTLLEETAARAQDVSMIEDKNKEPPPQGGKP